eukprot:6208338-Pleurochrysis_carterae.AAC.2
MRGKPTHILAHSCANPACRRAPAPRMRRNGGAMVCAAGELGCKHTACKRRAPGVTTSAPSGAALMCVCASVRVYVYVRGSTC